MEQMEFTKVTTYYFPEGKVNVWQEDTKFKYEVINAKDFAIREGEFTLKENNIKTMDETVVNIINQLKGE